MNLEQAREQIVGSHKFRGAMYYYFFDEMEKELGNEKAAAIFERATHRRGEEVHEDYKGFLEKDDFPAAGKHFCDTSPIDGELFFPKVEAADASHMVITMRGCPLVDVWREMGLSDEKVELLCKLSCGLDYGNFDTDLTKLSFTGYLGRGDEECRLVVEKREK